MYRLAYYAVAALVLIQTASINAAPPEPLVLAVQPYLPAAEIVTRFTPLAGYLGHKINRPVVVRVGHNYAEHIDAVGTDSVDLAYIGPVPYVRLVTRYGMKPLLARQEVNNQPYLHGVIIVRQDSPLRELAQLKGKRFAYGDPESTMSHVLPRSMLQQAGVPERALAHHQFLGAHKNVALAVLAGDFDAGAVKEEVFQEFEPKGLRALATMPPVADHVFVASAKLPPELVERLRRALLELKDTSSGKAILTALHKDMTALVPAKDSDYNNLRMLMDDAGAPH